MKVYGIKNCNTVKKALNWLDNKGIAYEFHDYKKSGISLEDLTRWEKQLGWQSLLNKKGTTWRACSPEEQQSVVDSKSALTLMSDKTSLIKRPLIESQNELLIGFNEQEYAQKLGI